MRGLEFIFLGILFIACGLAGSLLLETVSALSVTFVGSLLTLFGIYEVTAGTA